MKKLRFILVHGTLMFKNSGAWTLEPSPLTHALRETFENAEVERFLWDGKNSIRSRLAASQALATRLNAINAAEPDEIISIIAHSHGGNIAFDAIASLPLKNKVGALVTLGTPYFEYFPRETGNATIYAMSLALGTSLMLGIGASIVLKSLHLPFAAVIIALSALFVGMTLLLRKRLHRNEQESATWLDQFRRRHGANDLSILCIRFGLDEARIWLSALNFVRKLDKFVLRHARTYLGLTKEKIGAAVIALVLLVFGLVYPPIDFLTPLLLKVISLFLSVASICIALLIVASPLAVLASFIASHRFGFGGQSGFPALQFDLKVSNFPPSGNLFIERFSSTLALIRGLYSTHFSYTTPHALGYTDKKSIRFLCRWIKNMTSIY